MNKIIGLAFSVFVAFAAGFAFSARKLPPMPPTVTQIQNVLLLDAQRVGTSMIAVGERGHIFVSENDGRDWQRVATNTESTLASVAFADERLGLAVGHDALILRSEDGGKSWQEVFSAPEQMRPLLRVAFHGPDRAVALGAYGAFFESADGGKTWAERSVSEEDRHLNAHARLADGTLLLAGEAGTLLRSTDGGTSFARIESPYAGSFFGLLALPQGPVLAYGMRGKIFRSEDGGLTWSPAQSDSESSLFGGTLVDENTVVLVGQNGVVVRSEDRGRRFVTLPAQGSRALSAVLMSASQKDEALVFGEGGVTRLALRGGEIK